MVGLRQLAVVLTALPIERQAACEQLTGLTTVVERGTEYAVGQLAGAGVEWTVAVGETKAGNVSAAVHVGRAIEVFSPDVLLFVGIAGGVKDVALGDVVVADRVYGYETGKDADAGFLPRGAADRPAYRLVQRGSGVVREQRWLERIKPSRPSRLPSAVVGAIAAGEKVVASTSAPTYELLRRNYSDVLAVEMEGSGFLQAAYEYDMPAVVVRGISDLLDGKVQANDELWQPIAARHAAALAVEILATLGPPPTDAVRRWKPAPEFVAVDASHSKTGPLVVRFAAADRPWATWITRVLREAGYDVAQREAEQIEGVVAVSDVTLRLAEIATDEASARERVLEAVGTYRQPDRIESSAVRFGKGPRFPASMPPIWHIPVPRIAKFTGREKELRELAEILRSRETTAVVQTITGLGGVGKTTVAVEYAHRRRGDYDVVWWIRAEEPAVLATDFAALVGPLGLHNQRHDQMEAIAAVRRWLEDNDRWLLVFDNAGSPAEVESYLPRQRRGHVLATSRNQLWLHRADVLRIGVPPLEDAVTFLRRRAELATADAEVLAEAVGRLPAAMEIAGAYIAETGRPVSSYLDHTHRSMVDVFAASFGEIDVDPVARTILDVCAVLAPEDIPRSLLSQYVGGASVLDSAIRTLRRYSMIDVVLDAVAVHRLVQEARLNWIGPDASARCRAEAVAAVSIILPDEHEDPVKWPTFARLLPHVLVATEGIRSGATGALLSKIGNYQRAIGNLPEARSLLERSLEIAQEAFEPLHPNVGAGLTNLGLVLHDLGDTVGARSLLEGALAISEKALGPAHPNVAAALSNLAALRRELGEPAEAKPLLERALAIDEAALGPADPAVAVDLCNLAMVLQSLADASGARSLLERALAINETAFGPSHPAVATCLGNLASVLRDLGDAAEARPLAERALAISEAVLNPSHPAIATCLSNLAAVLLDMAEPAQARELLERALRIDEAVLGLTHPAVATRLNNLAMVLIEAGDITAARPLLERALAIGESTLGRSHWAVSATLGNLALVLRDLGDASGARPLLERALAIDEAALGPAHPSIGIDLGNLAMLLHSEGNAADALPLAERALAITEEALGPRHPTVGACLRNLTMILRDVGDVPRALPVAERALAITEETLGPWHPTVATCLRNLAIIFVELNQGLAARSLFERALAICEASLGPEHPSVSAVLSELAAVLRGVGDVAAARPLLERAVKIDEATLGAVHPSVAVGLGNLAVVAEELGDVVGARLSWERALTINEAALGPLDRRSVQIAARLEDLNESLSDVRHRTADELADALIAAGVVSRMSDLVVRPGRVDVPTRSGTLAVAAVAPQQLDVSSIPVPPRGQTLVVVADVVPAPIRHALRRRGWGWLDRRGHLRIVGPNLDVDSTFSTAAASEQGRRVFSPVGIDVAFEILVRLGDTLSVRGIARAVSRSPSQVSTVLGRLREAGLVLTDGTVDAPALFRELADHWRPRWEYVAQRPHDDALLDTASWVVADTSAALAWGIPLVATGDYPPDFYVSDERVVRHATRVLGSAAPGRHACAIALPPARGVLAHAVVDDFGRRLAHPVAVALDLSRDQRGRDALASWTPPPGYERVW